LMCSVTHGRGGEGLSIILLSKLQYSRLQTHWKTKVKSCVPVEYTHFTTLRSIAPCKSMGEWGILSLSTGCRRVVAQRRRKSSQCALARSWVGSEDALDAVGNKNPYTGRESSPGRPAHSLAQGWANFKAEGPN
jgi:hypothetical protein